MNGDFQMILLRPPGSGGRYTDFDCVELGLRRLFTNTTLARSSLLLSMN